VKLRNSVLLANKTNGVLVSPGTDPAASNDLSASTWASPATSAATTCRRPPPPTPTAAPACAFERVMSTATLNVRARGNFFAGKDCTVTNAGRFAPRPTAPSPATWPSPPAT
jgi:hypothetical protein